MKKPHLFGRNWSSWLSHDDARRNQKPRRIAFEALENRCLLSVGLGSLSDVTMSAGTTLCIPLAGSAASENTAITFAATASDYSKLTPSLAPQTDQSLKLNVNINGADKAMTFKLFDDLTPITTAAIENLVKSGYYNGLVIYRNAKGTDGTPFVIQGGNNPPTSSSIKANQTAFGEEFSPLLQYTSAGVLGMARSTIGTSSTEFFITEQLYRYGDYKYTIFGCQTSGTDVVSTIAGMTNLTTVKYTEYLASNVTITSASIFTDTQNGVLRLTAPAGVTGSVTVTVVASVGTDVSVARTFTVTITADSSTSPANPWSSAIPAAPTSIALTGGATSTNLNNSATSKTLQFLVSGVTSGNEVEILADGNVIGSATATGSTVTVTTNGSWPLSDGSHTFTAIQVAPDKTATVYENGDSTAVSKTADVFSANSAAMTLTVDSTAPAFAFTPITMAVIGHAYTCQVTTDDSTAVYQLDQPPTGMAINPQTGAISWTPASGQASPVTVTVRATDAAGNYALKTFAIDVLPDNLPPVLVAANPGMGTTMEDTAVTISLNGTFINNGSGTTTVTDANQSDALGGIALFGVTGNGKWEYSLNGTTFTEITNVATTSALLLDHNAVLRYTPDGENGETPTISYRAWDATTGADGGRLDLTLDVATSAQSPVSTASDTATLSVSNVNDAPVLTPASPSMGNAAPGVAATISLVGTFIENGTAATGISDVDVGATRGGIALTATTGGGTWEYSLNGADFTAIGAVSGSSALLLPKTATLRYTPAAGSSETATISYHAWDTTSGTAGDRVDLSASSAVGGTTAFSTATDTASISVNTAPVLTPASPSLGSTNEETAVTVDLSSFINHTGGTTTTDADANDSLGGIAIVGKAGNGTWAYSLDGTNFAPIGTVSQTAALLLPATAKLRYTPDAANGETATITYRAWDKTTGIASGTADTTTNGGTSAFSSATDTASLTVTSLNDAPVLTAASPKIGPNVSTAATIIALSGTIINNGTGTTSITDADTGATIGIALTGVTGSGDWAYSLDGTTFHDLSSISETDALLLPSTATLRFIPDALGSGTATFTYRAWDGTTGAAGEVANTTTNGATAFSTATDTATLSLNDAPALTAASPTAGTTILGSAVIVNLTGTFINNGTSSTKITDVDSTDALGGIAITGKTGSGTWAYSLNGTTFTDFPTVSDTSALLLPSTAKLRYTPTSTVSESATITYHAWDKSTGTAGGTADTTTNGGATAFSSATDTASIVVAGGSISGYVYLDTNNDGLRTMTSGSSHKGLPGVIVTLSSKGSDGTWTTAATKLTGSDGSYQFANLAPGTYRVTETQPSNYIDGIETVGVIAGEKTGTANADQFEVGLTAGAAGTEYNFGERGLKATAFSLQYLVYPAMSASQIIGKVDATPAVYLSGSASNAGYSTTFTSGSSAVAIAASTATIVDADSTLLASMTVSIIGLLDGSSETLAADVTGTSVTSSYSGGVLTLTGAASVSDYVKLLKKVTYNNASASPTAGNRTIEVVVNDGVVDSKAATATVNVKLSAAAVDAVLSGED
ncbi:MAG: peptidylprolyl isomerase [Thermoguttaceae bacterium]